MKYFRVLRSVFLMVCAVLFAASAFSQTKPEPAGWYAGDMHVHRSCGSSPEAVSTMFSKMSTNNLSATSLLADMGNGEVQNAVSDLPLVNGQDDPISTSSRKLHWDAEWHWDATYSQYAHQALGGHIVGLGLSNAHQIWQEYTFPILDWAHQQNGIAGFAHMQYLDSGFPQSLTCCTPIEYPVEVALGAADFISEDVDDVNSGFSMHPENFIQAYYRLLNSGFRPGFAAGTDYPCNSSRDLGSLLTYVQVAGGQMSYRNWIDGIANGRTVVSRNGHTEFLNLTVNTTSMPGDEIRLAGPGDVSVNVQWTATQSLNGTIELVQNGNIVSSKTTSAGLGSPATLTATVNFTKSGWLVARRMSGSDHYVHTAAVFVTINNAPVRASAADPQFYVDWMTNLLSSTSPGGQWSSYFPTQRAAAQSRYQDAKSLFQQIVAEANGTASTLSSITVAPANKSAAAGAQQSFTAAGLYSGGTTLNITAQARWTSSNTAVATINPRGLATAVGLGTTTITALLNGVSGSTTFTVATNPLNITTQSLSAGTVGTSYSDSLAASGGTQPYAWSISGGSLPNGLSLNSSTGSITGTPTTAGTFNFTARVTDSSSPQSSVTAALSIPIASSGAVNCPCSIWPSTTQPGTPDSGPDSSVEIGVKFRPDRNGFITGLRFYKGVGNTGTHVGNLWSSNGTRLATATFSGETSSGWQQALFSSPVAVTANTTYVASYHAPNGHYADNLGYFASSGIDNSPLHALADGTDGSNGVYSYGSTSSFPSNGYQSTNYWVDVIFTTSNGPDTTPPSVTAVNPANAATNVSTTTTVSATFSEALDPTTISASTFHLFAPGNVAVSGTVTYNSGTASFQPEVALATSTTYTAVITGGSSGVKDLAGNAMTANFTWSFTTGAAPGNTGPGGPILVIASSGNPFSRYYGEILSAEGLNEYTVADVATITPSILANYEVAILGDMPLTASQVTMLTTWVNGGGNLIAMHPDKQLAGLLGLIPSASTLSNGYLLVNNSSGPGQGIVGQTIQYHGPADLYTVSGSTRVATLYSNATTSTTSPAVSIANAGAGQAAAFTYDLARSIVYTHQGNPAWSGQKRDGQIPPTRSDDLYFGAASFDPRPDWVDLNKVSIPQADEQQRLLVNLILQMEADRKPLPRFWYFPSGFKAVVVMTGDDHANGGTPGRFDSFVADSPSGCSVADWKCVRATAYVYPSTPITNTQAASYVAKGFEVALHVTTDCSDWTPASLQSYYSSQLADFAGQFASIPTPRTNRTHCIALSDYDTQPQVELSHGIRLDTNYYYWPPTWINDQPGMFTGSGIPMRFTDRNGNLIDVYQATTQMTDESGQSYPLTIDSLLDNAVGPQGFYGAFTANMHNDSVQSDGADAIVASAQARNVPIVSAQQMLTWLDGRNTSSFGSLSWSGNTLAFSIVVGTGANNLQAMLPTSSTAGTLSTITRNGTPVSFSTQSIKGVQYAFFSAVAGSYQATFGIGGTTVTLASLTLNPPTVQGGSPSTGTVVLSGAAPTGGAIVILSSNNTSAQIVGSVTVLAGATTATFTVTTSAVSSPTAATITGTYGSAQTAVLTINPPAGTLTSLTLNPTSLVGGNSSTGTVTLASAAPTGGALVTLSSSNTVVAQTPSSVTVSAGATTATFSVTTSGVAATSSAVITATYGTPKTATLTINPATLLSLTRSPQTVTGGASSTGTATLNGAARPGGAIVTLQSNTSAAMVPGSITIAAGARTATFTITTTPVAVNTTATITGTYGVSRSTTLTINPPTLSSVTKTPASVVGGNNVTGTVTLNGAAPTGGAIVTLQSNNTSVAQVSASVTIAAGSRSATFPITTSGVASYTSVTITAVYGATRTTTLTVSTAAFISLTLSPSAVTGGASSTGTVTLNGAAPPGGALFTLTSTNTTAAQVPSSATIQAGASSVTFPVTTGAVHGTSSTIRGVYRSTVRSATLTVQ